MSIPSSTSAPTSYNKNNHLFIAVDYNRELTSDMGEPTTVWTADPGEVIKTRFIYSEEATTTEKDNIAQVSSHFWQSLRARDKVVTDRDVLDILVPVARSLRLRGCVVHLLDKKFLDTNPSVQNTLKLDPMAGSNADEEISLSAAEYASFEQSLKSASATCSLVRGVGRVVS